jgi:uncharacterized membrane protein YeaQ/YmgE (transglycosylase-associated protein family)
MKVSSLSFSLALSLGGLLATSCAVVDGLVGDLIVGIIGAFIGDRLLPRLGIHLGAGIVALVVNATLGAMAVVQRSEARHI